MADVDENLNLEDPQDFSVDTDQEDPGVETQPAVPEVPASPKPSPDVQALIERMNENDRQSQLLFRQMMEADARRQATVAAPAGPEIPNDILEGATPIVRKVLGKELEEIGNLRSVLSNLIAENQGSKEKSFILGQVPDWESVKADVASHIHGQLDALGVPQDPAIRRQYFTPVSVVTAANYLKAQKGQAAPPSDALAPRSVVEGRGGGTNHSAALPSVDYATMSDADFAKHEAKLNEQRMRRNHG